ncbi:hypothetical protein HBDW_38070 [Herbaspirillum sp. DW155]|uniref:hypothetical protein n=1 Tax=Herbaspirillum sp. DW155 TaxID=3095609 RepID=UPI00308CEE20|nr:hypothetical protein HBDW_38070 [Herbaspirillum sp. DW155]
MATRREMKRLEKAALGSWRITSMELWDVDYFDMEVPAHITIKNDLTGTLQFGLVQGDIDARVHEHGSTVRIEFSWSGVDENDPVSGRGWLEVTGDEAQGRIFIHLGDDSAFTAERSSSECVRLATRL